ncbi:MAG: glycine--tRNA ligase subunit beta [Arenicellales bacterium]
MSQAVNTQSLLIELGTEELPPKALKQLSESFSNSIISALRESGLIDDTADFTSYAAPRRLAILINAVSARQADFTQLRKGPAVQAAYDADGNATKAAQGFARSCGVEVDALATDKTEQGEWLVFEQTIKGKSITECTQAALDAAITQLPIPKRMRWGDKTAEFVRPVHWLLALYGKDVLALNTLGLTASNTSRGHRFHAPDAITLKHADDYADALEKAYVLADYDARQARIKNQCETLAKQANGIAVLSEGLLDEVTALVEWPVSVLGSFDEAFLDVPREALIASMKDHQKYFHLTDEKGALLAKFITVSNIESAAPEKVLGGNERVLHARLSDAQFFWTQDKQQKLEAHAPRLEQLLFHVKLGSVTDKTQRLEIVSGKIAELISGDVAQTQRAAKLCKLDLLSNMVGEFASLQGTMGRYYAELENESPAVSSAIEQHYWPKFAGDQLPEDKPAIALALADRLDSLVGIFTTGEKPSGVKDPYALRRAALGVLRILIEKKLDLSLQTLLEISIDAYAQSPNIHTQPDSDTQDSLNKFILDRLRAYYIGQDFDINAFKAVAEVHPERAYDFDQRIRAVSEFFAIQKTAATALAAANKRIANILRKNPSEAEHYNSGLFTEAAERDLASALEAISPEVNAAFKAGDYAQGLTQLATLEQSVNVFFDDVRVIDEDETIRNNRLGLLKTLRGLFLQVADISHLNVEA